MNRKRKLIQDFNRHLICILCGGYFIDATTIIECLHSFCRACIVQYLEHNRFCPVCDVQVHKSKPLQNIRHDRILQDLVYKLVPGLFQKEMRCRQEFLSTHQAGSATCALLPRTDHVTPFYAPDECFSITLEYWHPASGDTQDVARSCAEPLVVKKRYLRCPAAVTVAHLGRLLLAKHGLHTAPTGPTAPTHSIQFVHKDESLHDHLMLMDIAYIYKWRRVGPLKLSYRIFENDAKRIKLESSIRSNDPCVPATDPCLLESEHVRNMSVLENTDLKEEISDWKEVQLQISETGIMSVSGISVEHNNNVKEPTVPVSGPCLANEPPTIFHAIMTPTAPTQFKAVNDQVTSLKETPVELSMQRATEIAKLNVEGLAPLCAMQCSRVNSNSSVSKVKDKPSPHIKQKESLDFNSKLGTPKVQKIGSVSVSKQTGCSLTGTGITSIKGTKVVLKQDCADLTEKKSQMAKNALSSDVSPPQTTKKSSNSNSMGYKTLKVPPKTWNPSITRSSYLNSQKHMSNSDSPENSKASLSSVKSPEKAPKFFKMRNMPRYLGNPASGVKPMYQVVNDSKAQESVARKKQTVIKIDPKTLSPIVSVVSVSGSAVLESSNSPSKAFYSSGQMVGSKTKSVSSSFSTCVRDVLKQGPYKSALSPPYRNSTATSKALSNSSVSSNLSKTSASTVSSNSAASNDLSSPHGTSPKNIRVHTQPSFAFNAATLNLLSSNLSFLPNTSNFLYGNFSSFGSSLLRPGLNLSSGIPLAEGNSCPNLGIATNNLAQGLGAFHSMPPSINMLFPHMRTSDRSNVNHPQTPAVQRIPASKGNASMSTACAKSNTKSVATGTKSSQMQGVTCPKIESHLPTRHIPNVNDNSAGEMHPDDSSKPKLCVHPQKLDSNNTDAVPMKVNTSCEMCEQKKVTCKEEQKWTSVGKYVLHSSIEKAEMRPRPATKKDLETTVNPEKEKMGFNLVFQTNVSKTVKVEPGLLLDIVKVEKTESTEDKHISENAAEIASETAEEKLVPENAGAELSRKIEAMVGIPAIDRVEFINREGETVVLHMQTESKVEAQSANSSNDIGLTELVLVTKSKVMSAEESSMARDITPSSRANNNSNTSDEVQDKCTNVLMSSTVEDEKRDNVAGIDRAFDVKMCT